MKIAHLEEIASDSFGLWISGLFSAISGWNPDISFQDQKVAFFVILERFLEEGRIRFCPPNELWKEGCDIWHADTQTILQYFRMHWPDNVSSENDIALTDYFYAMPAILWVGRDGTLHGS